MLITIDMTPETQTSKLTCNLEIQKSSAFMKGVLKTHLAVMYNNLISITYYENCQFSLIGRPNESD